MSDDSISVNIGSGNRSYHHGNLRAALISAGLEALSSMDSEQLSIRKLAKSLGVSATSVYRHFPNKHSFLAALCHEGGLMLASAQRVAMKKAGGGQAGLDASGLAYVRFAISNRALFRLISDARTPNTGLGSKDDPAMQELLVNVDTLLPNDATPEERKIRALHAWSVVHGVAMLVLEGRVPQDDELIGSIIRNPTF